MPPKADESKRLFTKYFVNDLAQSEDACDATVWGCKQQPDEVWHSPSLMFAKLHLK